MNRHVEIEARVFRFESLVERVEAIAAEDPTVVHKEDTFFMIDDVEDPGIYRGTLADKAHIVLLLEGED